MRNDWQMIVFEVSAEQWVFWSSSAFLMSFATEECFLQLKRRQRMTEYWELPECFRKDPW